ncbi:MAG: KTSC domain-containing protein [Desulfobacterales bacterium]|nr:KTSC domain-containing protein [Desulfobacterales bacterium]
MDGDVMEILNYKESIETLYVQFNTKYIWEYKPVTKEMYTSLLSVKDYSEMFKSMVRNEFLIGTIKEVNNDFKS